VANAAALNGSSIVRASADTMNASLACARQVLDAVPLLMREIRSEMRQSAPAALSVPSFRALIFAHANAGALDEKETGPALVSLYATETDAEVKRAVLDAFTAQGNCAEVDFDGNGFVSVPDVVGAYQSALETCN
jgi:hypothetical protein